MIQKETQACDLLSWRDLVPAVSPLFVTLAKMLSHLRRGGAWAKPSPCLHPVVIVLNIKTCPARYRGTEGGLADLGRLTW